MFEVCQLVHSATLLGDIILEIIIENVVMAVDICVHGSINQFSNNLSNSNNLSLLLYIIRLKK